MEQPTEYIPDVEALKWLDENKPVGKVAKYKPKKVRKLPASADTSLLFSDGELTKITVEKTHFTEVNQIPQIRVQRTLSKLRMKKFISYAKNTSAYSHYSGRVAIAVRYPNKQTYLIDGNTRLETYHRERVKALETGIPSGIDLPEYINLIIFDVPNVSEGEQLYFTYDNKNATETVPDKLSGAMESIGKHWGNPVLSSHRFKTGLKEIAKITADRPQEDISEERALLSFFLPELEFINKTATFPTNSLGFEVVAYMVAMLHKSTGDDKEWAAILDFFNSVGGGYNDLAKNGKKNAVTLLMREYDKTNSNRIYPHKSAFRKPMFGLWVLYYEDYKNSKMRSCPITVNSKKDVDNLTNIFNSYFAKD